VNCILRCSFFWLHWRLRQNLSAHACDPKRERFR